MMGKSRFGIGHFQILFGESIDRRGVHNYRSALGRVSHARRRVVFISRWQVSNNFYCHFFSERPYSVFQFFSNKFSEKSREISAPATSKEHSFPQQYVILIRLIVQHTNACFKKISDKE